MTSKRGRSALDVAIEEVQGQRDAVNALIESHGSEFNHDQSRE